MRRLPLLMGTLIALALVLPAHAASFQQGDTLSISLPLHDNLYAAGGTVIVQSPVDGDVLAAGGTIRIQGSVGNTLQAAGGQVTVLAPVQKSARLAGGNVSISAPVGGDLVIFGGQVSVESGAVIAGDLVAFGGNVTMNGKVKGKLKAFGGQIAVVGTVDGPAEVNAETAMLDGIIGGDIRVAANTLTVGQRAAFQKTVTYWTQKGQMDFGRALTAGNSAATYDVTLARTAETKAYQTAKGTGTAIAGLFGIYSLLSSVLFVIFFLLLGRPFFAQAGDRLRLRPWWSLLIGFLYFAVAPIAILLLFATLIGIPLAFLALALYVFSWVFGCTVTAILLARWIEVWNGKQWNLGIFFLVSVLVLLGLQVLFFIPILGWIARGALLCMAFGALLSMIIAWWKRAAAS